MSSWWDQAACKGMQSELFFPGPGESTLEGKTVCAGCPVREDCLAYALAVPERFGIFGGTSERERLRMRHRRPPAEHGSRTKYGSGCRCGPCTEANRIYQVRRKKASYSISTGDHPARTAQEATV